MKHYTTLAAVLLACACVLAQGDSMKSTYQFATGESMQLMGDSCSFKYYPSKSANCTDCFLFFKLGALSELDAYGQPIKTHMLPDLSKLAPELASGKRVSGNAEYEYVTMTFSGQALAAALSPQTCPTLESILTQAYQMGLTQEGPAATGINQNAASVADSGILPAGMALSAPGSNAAIDAVLLESSNGRRLAQASGASDLWLTAPDCKAPSITTIARDKQGRGWGFEGGKSCAVRSLPVKPISEAVAKLDRTPPVTTAASARRMSAPTATTKAAASSSSAQIAVQRLGLPYSANAAAAAVPMTMATAAPLAAPVPRAGAMFANPGAVPHLKITFMFGFSNNKTFPYGRGNSLTAPAGGIKWTLEADSWPFCSPYNTLKLELVAVSGQKDNQAQFVMSPTDMTDDSAETTTDTMMTNYPVPAVRRLHAATQFSETYGASFFEPEKPEATKRAAVGLPLGPLAGLLPGLPLDSLATLGLLQDRLPKKRLDRAKLLVGPGLAATIELPTFAFASADFSSLSNVTTVLASNNTDGAARFSSSFGYFTSGLYYEGIIYFSSPLDMNIASELGVLPPNTPLAAANCPPGDRDCATRGGRRRGTGNAATKPSSSLSSMLLSLMLALSCTWVLQH